MHYKSRVPVELLLFGLVFGFLFLPFERRTKPQTPLYLHGSTLQP